MLDFDKFRALDTSKDENITLDETVLSALSNYSSILENATFEARRLANEMLIENGWFDENGVFNKKKLEETKQKISAIGDAIKIVSSIIIGNLIRKSIASLILSFTNLGNNMRKAFSLKTLGVLAIVSALFYLYTSNEEFRKSVNRLFTAVSSLLVNALSGLKPIFDIGIKLLNNVVAPILTGIINLVAWVVELVDKLGILDEIIIGILAYSLLSKIIPLATIWLPKIAWGIKNIGFLIQYAWSFVTPILSKGLMFVKDIGFYFQYFLTTTAGLITGLVTLAVGVYSFINAWGDMGWGQRIITMFSAITAGVIGLVIALKALHLGVPAAIALGAMLAGGVLMIGSSLAKNSVNKFANGGMPDKGTMFVAGEAGAEIVYNTPSGQSGVANIQQIEQAMYGDLVRYGRTQGNGQPIEVYLDGEKVYQNTTAHAKRRGNVWGKA